MGWKWVAERLGVFGGTFDPPHVGHAIVALDVRERLELDRLLIVPAGEPPHREPVFPARVRHELVSALFDGVQGLEVSGIEMGGTGPSYTVETLARVRALRNPEELFCVFGVDQLRVLDSWRDFRRLPELATLAVMMRAGEEACAPHSGPEIPYIAVEVTRIDVSSTEIRERLRNGRSIRYVVPESIRATVERAWAELAPPDPRPATVPARPRTNREDEC